MAIELIWKTSTPNLDAVRIYRSEAEFDLEALPAPLVDLPGDALSYSDEAVEYGKLYHYLVNTVRGEEEIIGEPKGYLNLSYTGPGPQEILRGDPSTLALYGVIDKDDFYTNIKLKELLGAPGIVLYNNHSSQKWFKVAYKGKILYIPALPLAYGVNWDQLYQAGLVYGSGDAGPAPVGDPVVQDKAIRFNGDLLKARLFKGYSTNPAPEGLDELMPEDASEYAEIIYSLTHTHETAVPLLPRVLYEESLSINRLQWCQEHSESSEGVDSGERMTVGMGNSGVDYLVTRRNARDSSLGGNLFVWRPVLEYVPNQ